VRLERNALVADADGTPRPTGSGETRLEPVELVFKAVGYRGVPIPGIPFDARSGTFPNRDGRLIDPLTGDALRRQYVVGWAKRGPTGLIGSNHADSAATVAQMLADLPALEGAPDPSPAAIPALLASRAVDAVTWEDWRRLDREEIERGARAGKIREKHTTVPDLMAAIRRLRPPAR
jgi:ferredoxin--NADP+ reductase